MQGRRQFSLRAFLIVAASVVPVCNWGHRYAILFLAQERFMMIEAAFDAEERTFDQVADAADDCLAAELRVPFRNQIAAHATHVRRMARLKSHAENFDLPLWVSWADRQYAIALGKFRLNAGTQYESSTVSENR
jgi:hypothetical protein